MPWPSTGELFQDRYRIDAVLGDGGQAVVYAATDIAAGRAVAVKLLKREADGYAPAIEARFQREHTIIARLSDPHTVRLFDHGTTADGLLYLVFEHVAGRDLTEVLDEVGQLDEATTVHIVRQVLHSLREAHSHGIVHRDVKPHNVRVFEHMGDPWFVKLLDFGIARAAGGRQGGVTVTGGLVGTPRYMSPEQLLDQPVTPASDLYSVGVLSLELLMGAEVLHGERWGDQLARLQSGYLLSASAAGQISPGLLAVLGRLTARDPAQRYRSADEVLAALDAPPRPAAPMAPHPAPAPPSSQRPPPEPTQRSGPLARPASHWVVAVLISMIAVAVGILAVMLTGSDDAAPTTAPARTDELRASALVSPPSATSPAAPEIPPRVEAAPRDPDSGCGRAAPFVGRGSLRGIVEDKWLTWIPRGYDAQTPVPLVVLFHPFDVTPAKELDDTNFGAVADEAGFVVLLPDDSRPLDMTWREPGDYLEHVLEGISEAKRQLCIDDTRIFAIGHGNGGRAAEYVRCRGDFAAVATVSYRADEGEAICAARVPLLDIASSTSCHYPIEGGQGCNMFAVKVPLAHKQKVFRKENGCSGPARLESKKDGGTCTTWRCDAPFVSCLIEVDYEWNEGRKPRGPTYPVGQRVWDFFDSVRPSAAQ